MLIREEYLKKISDFLAEIEVKVKNRSILRLFDQNVIMETFFAEFLNAIYDYRLENLNFIQANNDSIDLGDKENRICYQITSNGKNTKVQNTIDGFRENEWGKEYDTLRLLIVGAKQKSYNSLNTHNLTFTAEGNIFDLRDILKDIQALSTTKLEQLCEIIVRETSSNVLTARQPDPKERPRLFFKSTVLKEPLMVGSRPVLQFVIFNGGETQAQGKFWDNTWTFSIIKPFRKSLEYIPDGPDDPDSPLRFTLEPGAEVHGELRYDFLVTIENIEPLQNGHARLYFFARGEYRGEDGQVYPFPLCRMYDRDMTGRLKFCSNDITIGGAPPSTH